MDGMNGKSVKMWVTTSSIHILHISSLYHLMLHRLNKWTEMEAEYSGGQSSPWAVAPRGRKEGVIRNNGISYSIRNAYNEKVIRSVCTNLFKLVFDFLPRLFVHCDFCIWFPPGTCDCCALPWPKLSPLVSFTLCVGWGLWVYCVLYHWPISISRLRTSWFYFRAMFIPLWFSKERLTLSVGSMCTWPQSMKDVCTICISHQ
jgi:hypothetical protein